MVGYPYAIMKRIFHFSRVMVTTVRRVRMKFMFAFLAYNLHSHLIDQPLVVLRFFEF